MKRLIAPVALAAFLILAPATVSAYSCAGKADGQWCHNNEIWICDGGEPVFTDPCLWGCDQGAGPNASCSPKPCTGFCCGKADGEWCVNGNIWICDNDVDVFIDTCLWGCKEGAGPNADCAPKPCTGYCCGKADGQWCHNEEIWICDNQEDVFIDPCLWGCDEGDGPNGTCAPKPCEGFCCGKADGQWCHNNEILICDSDEDVFADPCLGGCEEGEGPDASCLPPPGFCMDKEDGTWCDGDTVRTCDGGIVTVWKACLLTCQGEPDAACTEDIFCDGKQNGPWCPDVEGDVIDCQGGEGVELVDCGGAGCIQNEDGEKDVCDEPDPNKPPDGYCEGKPDTDTCWNDVLVTCDDGEATSWVPCPAGCGIHWPDEPDACEELVVDSQYCADKTDYWCYEDAAVVWCSGGFVAAVEECLNGCAQQPLGTDDLCMPEDPDLFCSHHSQGAWCNGPEELINCHADGTVAGVLPCEAGCVKAPFGQDDVCPAPPGCSGTNYAGSPISVTIDANCCPTFVGSTVLNVPVFDQLSSTDDMGNCDNKTIDNFGCGISSLSAFYEYMGTQRKTANGVAIPNTPKKENKWRTNNGGYIGCLDDNTCCLGEWTWQMNPQGFGDLLETFNSASVDDDSECLLSLLAAKVIAAELNSGTPIVAHVFGGETEQHWVLVVGVDGGGGLLLNDPWNGYKARAFTSGAGLGPYSGLMWLFSHGGIGPGDGIPPWYEQPVPPEGHEVTRTGGTVLTPAGEEMNGRFPEPTVETPADDSTGPGGCAAGPASAGPTSLLLLLLLAGILRRRISAG